MKIIIDADACPVTDIVTKIAIEKGIHCIIVCDDAHKIIRENIETIVVSQGKDAVDFVIISKTEKNDIIVTQDYGLGSIILSKNAYCINQNGLIINKYNIESLLFNRHMSQKLRNSGKKTKGPKKRTLEQDKSFKNNFIYLLEQIYNS